MLRQTSGSIQPIGRSPFRLRQPPLFSGGCLYFGGNGMKSGRFPHDVLFDVQVENTPVDIDFLTATLRDNVFP